MFLQTCTTNVGTYPHYFTDFFKSSNRSQLSSSSMEWHGATPSTLPSSRITTTIQPSPGNTSAVPVASSGVIQVSVNLLDLPVSIHKSFIQGTKWRTNLYTDESGVDTFDCRVRDWYKQAKPNQRLVSVTGTFCKLNRYLQAAAYPKDLVVLLDSSGSMRGLRIQIARATVEKLLDTLNDDDFFNIIQVVETASDVALYAHLIDKSRSSAFLCFSIQTPRNTSIPALMGH